ncbi:MAG: InlB B-repeat-containing protein [Bacilli bacterium]|nr:InlB B-repeat-containing protein [Bacilli bacterium]
MNKLFNKIAIAVAGIALAVGVGVGLSNREVTEVKAETGLTETISESDDDVRGIGASGGGTGATVTRDDIKLTFSSCYGHASNKLIVYGSSTIAFAKANEGDVITFKKIVMTGSSSTYIRSWNATTSTVSVSETVATWDYSTGVSSLTLTNGSNSQARLVSIVVTYDKVGQTYSVTYNNNQTYMTSLGAGTISGSVPTDATAYSSGATVTVKDNTGSLALTNYSFNGWNTAADGTGTARAAGATFSISENTTLYAQWLDTRSYCDITTSSDHLTLSGDTHVLEGTLGAEITISADAKWKIPTSITVSGAGDEDDNWSYSDGVLTILEVTGNVTVTGTATAASIIGIEVAVDSSETSFYLGHTFTHSTAVVTATYDDAAGTEEDVTSGCTWSSPDMFTTGNKTITVTHTASEETDTYDITVSNKVVSSAYYGKITSTASITSGTYLIVYESGSVALNSALTTDQASNTVAVTISSSKITPTDAINAAAFTFDASDGTFLGSGNSYIYHTGSSNTLNYTTTKASASNTVSYSTDHAVIKCGNYYLRYNSSTGQTRFRYYGSESQQAIQLYKYYPAVTKDLIKITAAAKSATRYVGDSVTVSDFTVTAYYDDGTNGSVTATSLTNATLSSTSNTVTVNYTENDVTKSVNVVVSAEERTAVLESLTWSQSGLTVFDGDELDFGDLATITANYDDDSGATKAIESCSVGLYSKDGSTYTLESAITDGHEWALSEDGLYLGVSYTEDAVTVKAYSSAVVNVVATINSVYAQVETYTFDGSSPASSIEAGDHIVLAYASSSKELSGINASNYGNVSSYTTNPSGAYVLEVEDGSSSGTYSFKHGSLYLALTSDANNLYASETKNANSSWTVSISNGTATITNASYTERMLQFNTSGRFACYKSSSNQKDAEIYIGTAGYAPSGSSVANTNAVAQKAALEYVDYFNTTMACVSDGSTANVSTKWTSVSTEFARILSEDLTGDDLTNFKALFANAYARGSDNYNDADALQDMLAKYNHIVSAHGVSDFLASSPINRPSAQYAIRNNPISALTAESSMVTVVIIVSLASIIAIGGYLFLRTKKED